ncbi:MAG: hypothetical protein IGS50_02540 [Synechococcales cyanobacterium C42_A2020_086]|nr:hypothetical protein [Synechococcales cyanobacterium C42_A2020_086]
MATPCMNETRLCVAVNAPSPLPSSRQLSSFTQYYIRKLLRQRLKMLDSPRLQPLGLERYFSQDLNVILHNAGASQRSTLIEQINTLVQLHLKHQQESHNGYLLAELEQRLFALLGVWLPGAYPLPATQPTLVQEEAGAVFRFFLNGRLRQGIRYGQELYGWVAECLPTAVNGLTPFLSSLAQQQVPFVLTVSSRRYAIWISLRSPGCRQWLR